MKLTNVFRLAYILCRVLFIVIIPLAIFSVLYHVAYLFYPNSTFAASFGEFEPLFSFLTIEFQKQPAFYLNNDIIILSFISTIAVLLLVLFSLRILDKLFQNIYNRSLFINKNVSLFYQLGSTVLVLGSIFSYLDGLLFDKTIEALNITNATVSFSNVSYVDPIITGIICLMIGAALRVAVQAVEENKYTI
ncbi:hypothetical protein [Gracilibacillus kekensis]|uniref:DUF2975 domain-containing protein n=1 Tax=Gracilibacillus kekensis TaxID=1027249 RepID=A0A1M7JHU8_9BACI|nr:hypothetical protein [Gracilibacillus kekensis]SHM52650.1 hypothetical protein SAMN05216179_0371 [Gracilibacillus kekensis]